MQNLEKYNQKRNFNNTLEPSGSIQPNNEKMRFVVQHHLATRDHYDFRLEWGGVLLSWAVPKGPSYNPKEKRLSIKVEDHPLDYRHFEGTIPKGEYGGGIVMLWDEGYWEPYGNVDEGLSEGSLKFNLNGIRLKGKWALIKLKAKEGDKKDNWLLLKEKDKYAKDEDGISEYDTSIKTNRTMKEIEIGKEVSIIKNPFDSANPKLAKLSKTIPKEENWLFELKYDGYRILAFIENNSVKLFSRNGKDYTNHFASVTNSLVDMAKGRAMVLDGEMTITNESGKTDFQALQNYIKDHKSKKLTYFIFDILAIDGEDIRKEQLIKRKEILDSIMQKAPSNLHYSRHVIAKGEDSFRVACELGMEGVVAKNIYSEYSDTRNGDWLKIKCDNRQEFVIVGYTYTDKKENGISALILGLYEGEKLIYAGRAGTGFNKFNTKKMLDEFKDIKIKKSPLNDVDIKARTNEEIIWLEPKLVAEIKFSEWTKDNQLRHASFKGLREDKDAKDVIIERTNNMQTSHIEDVKPVKAKKNNVIQGVKISSPDKIVYDNPKITKLDIVKYYEQVAKKMLPYLSYRVLSIVRCPKGVNDACFYKKHPGPSNKGIITIPIQNSEQKIEEYFYITDIFGIISEAQMGSIEFHIWGSKVDSLDKPDIMVFDLDPDEGMALDTLRQGARDLKSILDELSLKSYIKTSGGKGYHIVVPFRPNTEWEQFNNFAKRVAQVMEQKWPNRYTSNMRKVKRNNKIFIDWVRNGKGATSIAPYSLRARNGAKVSMPISWEELDNIAPDSIDMQKAIERINQENPWQDFFDNNQQFQ